MRLTVHVSSRDWFGVWERVHDECEQGPQEEDDVGEEADWAHPEGTVFDVVTAAEEEADDGNGVTEVEQDNASRDHTIMCELVAESIKFRCGELTN